MDEPLFRSTHAALTFAYNFQGNPAMSIMNRMIKNPGDSDAPPPKGLAGLDGAAQAGMIKRHVKNLGRFSEAMIIAEFAPRRYPCSCRSACCSGHTRNHEWSDAVNYIADIVRTEALDGHRTTHPIRRACVEKFFGIGVKYVKIASDLNINAHTFGQMIGKVRRYLKPQHERAQIAADDALNSLVVSLHDVDSLVSCG